MGGTAVSPYLAHRPSSKQRLEFSRLLTQMGDAKTAMKHGWKGRCSALKLVGFVFYAPTKYSRWVFGEGASLMCLQMPPFGEERKMGVQGKCFWRRPRGQSNKMKRALNAFSGHADRLSSVQ